MAPMHEGGITLPERLNRIEENQQAAEENVTGHVTRIWKEITAIKIQMERNQVKLAILVGILCFVASLLAQYALKKM